MRTVRHTTLILLLLVSATAAWVQAPVTTADIARLESAAGEIDRQVTTLKRTDPTLAAEVGRALADLRDEVTFLRVKLRREGAVTRSEYSDVRDRLETLRVKALGEKVYAQPVLPDSPGPMAGPQRALTVPVGTEMDVRLQTPLSSRTAKVEQRFEATTLVDVTVGKDVAVPGGSIVRGFVSSVRAAGRIDRAGSLTLSFDEIIVNQRAQKLRASVVKALDPKVGEDVSRIGAGAVVGAVIGGVLGGAKGALVGVLIGGGGTIASTEGTDVELPAGTILRIRVDQPLEISGPPK